MTVAGGEIIRGAGLVVSPWANGAGRKADIVSGEGWLIGFAWLDRDAPFSDYSGFDRTITLLEGPGFALELPVGGTLSVREAFVPAAFDGAGPIACRILGGPCRVLNAISAYPGLCHSVQVVSGSELGSLEPGALVFAVVLRGTVDGMGPSDSMRLGDGRVLTGSADASVAIIRIEQAGEDDA